MSCKKTVILSKLGFKIRYLASRLNINRSYLSQCLNDRKEMSFQLAKKLQVATGLSFLFFLLKGKQAIFYIDIPFLF